MSDTLAIFLAAPTSRPEQIRNCLCNAAPGCRVNVLSQSNSLLAFNFNLHWTAALNSRAKFGWTDFAMVHADVTPAVAGRLAWRYFACSCRESVSLHPANGYLFRQPLALNGLAGPWT